MKDFWWWLCKSGKKPSAIVKVSSSCIFCGDLKKIIFVSLENTNILHIFGEYKYMQKISQVINIQFVDEISTK